MQRRVLFSIHRDLTKKKDIEVHYMIDPIGDYAVQQFKEFDCKMFRSATQEGLDVDDEDVSWTPLGDLDLTRRSQAASTAGSRSASASAMKVRASALMTTSQRRGRSLQGLRLRLAHC
jgi:HSP90 family molecular chaperone